MKQSMRTLTSQDTVEWYTPPHIIKFAREVLGTIDLDPASCDVAQQWIRATEYYTIDTPLHGVWAGRVWLNPPFSHTPVWVNRLMSAYLYGHVSSALLLVNSAPGYKWYEELWRTVPVVCLRDRLHFIRADGTMGGQAKKAQTIAYFGVDISRFAEVFRPLGRILLP